MDEIVITNQYLIQRLREVESDMKRKNRIGSDKRISEQDRFFATLVAWYEATKDLI